MDLLFFIFVCVGMSVLAVAAFNILVWLIILIFYGIGSIISGINRSIAKRKSNKAFKKFRQEITIALENKRFQDQEIKSDLAFKSGCNDIKKFQGNMSGTGSIAVNITNGPKAEGLKKAKKEVSKVKKTVKKTIKK